MAQNGLGEDYWRANYSEPLTMDTIGNAKEHAQYLKSLFRLELIDINSIVDFGTGLGYLLRALMITFHPYEVLALEPSGFALEKAKKRLIKNSPNMKLRLLQQDILSWCRKNQNNKKFYDLGVCTSVLQYLPMEHLIEAVPIIASHVKFLYLTVPTTLEYKRLWEELEFKDDYCLSRSQQEYLKVLQKDFTFVSNRLLESKHFYHQENTPFRELLFRF